MHGDLKGSFHTLGIKQGLEIWSSAANSQNMFNTSILFCLSNFLYLLIVTGQPDFKR